MLVVCSVCGVELRCEENGVFARDGAYVRSGDRYLCRECGVSVIAGFGEPFGEYDAPQLYARVIAALDTGLPYVSHKTLQERF